MESSLPPAPVGTKLSIYSSAAELCDASSKKALVLPDWTINLPAMIRAASGTNLPFNSLFNLNYQLQASR